MRGKRAERIVTLGLILQMNEIVIGLIDEGANLIGFTLPYVPSDVDFDFSNL